MYSNSGAVALVLYILYLDMALRLMWFLFVSRFELTISAAAHACPVRVSYS